MEHSPVAARCVGWMPMREYREYRWTRLIPTVSRPHGGPRQSPYRSTRTRLVRCCLALVMLALAACGSAATAQGHQTAPALVTSSPTLAPPATSQPTPAPTPSATPPPSAPAILDVRPASMSLVGHLDCPVSKGAYVCLAKVLSRASNQSKLPWSASTNVPGGVVLSPSSGVLAPGQSVVLTIRVPLTACTHGLFFFRGPINTHTISWAC